MGTRVVDISWIIAGPTATRFLAMMGAEVIKVGSGRRPDPSTNSPAFQVYNQSKLYSALNISKPEGIQLARQLISVSDVVIENFAVGVIERRGLGYGCDQPGQARYHHGFLFGHRPFRARQGLCCIRQSASALHRLELYIRLSQHRAAQGWRVGRSMGRDGAGDGHGGGP